MKRTVWILIGILLIGGCSQRGNRGSEITTAQMISVSAQYLSETTIPEITEALTETSPPTAKATLPKTTVSKARAETSTKITTTPTTTLKQTEITTVKQTTTAKKEEKTTTSTETTPETTTTTAAVTTTASAITTTPTQITEPETTTAQPPEFNVELWLDMGREYACSVGLAVEQDAVLCWDNPIQAGSHCLYLERDIKGRLDRYAADPEITAVWFWAEPIGEGVYQIFIGYA